MRRFFVGLLILLVLFITVVILFSQRQLIITKIFPGKESGMVKQDSGSSSASSKVFRAKVPPVPTNRPQKPLKGTRLAKNQISSKAPAGKKKLPAIGEPSQSSTAAVGPRNSMTPATSSPQSKTATMSRILPAKQPRTGKMAELGKSTKAKSVPSGKPASRAKKSAKSESYERIGDSRLKLQALAWFIDPPKRMAVINSRIVREGESVDGYQVTKIRQQDVVVNDGRKSWRLEFGLKQ